ncbi:MAG TPA: hypothetical protein VF017_10675 [Thermoanaerobaculia bacterium]|nr:hypothetical protein [Thermoanaerobaculia bacterium]
MSTETSVSREDLELIAAVLDGRLSGKARSAALERIEADEALREVFAESARFLGEEEATSGLADPPAAQATTVHFWKVALPIAIAATLAAVLITWPRDWTARPAADYAKKLAGVGELPEDWNALPGQTRGDGAACSFRLGVDIVQLELALGTRDPARAADLARRVDSALKSDEFPFASEARTLAAQLVEELKTVEDLEPLLSTTMRLDSELTKDQSIDRLHYALGKWAEAGRLAAKLGQIGVFDRKFRSVASQAAERRDLDGGIQKAVLAMAGQLRKPPAVGDLAQLETNFGSLIADALRWRP